MNTEIKKKWFVYVGDHHEGPFLVQEILEKKRSGLITDESYVWCEGMSDWVMLSQAGELMIEIKKLESSEGVALGASPKKENSHPKKADIKNSFFNNRPKLIKLTLVGIFSVLFLSVFTLGILSRVASDELHAKLRPTLASIVDRAPFLSGFFKLVPNLSDIKAEELKELEQSRKGSPQSEVKIGIAISQNDSNRPSFYISTNLPDKTKLDLYIVGNSETLLNSLNYSSQMSVTTTMGFAKTDVFLMEGGQLIPKGEYQVYVTESSDQEESVRNLIAQYPNNRITTPNPLPVQIPASAHFLVSKTYFIGGERNETYLTRLKAFHEKIKQNSEREILELKQYTETLNFQFTTLTNEFLKVINAKKISPPLLANWKKTSDTWQQINGQLDQTIQTWSKETLQNEFFYGKVYELVKSAYDSLKALYQLENSYVNSPQDKSAFEIQHGKILSETRTAIELIRSKMDQISKAPKSPSGLPTREGL